MKQTNTRTVARSIRAGGKLVLATGAALLMAAACGGDDKKDGGDGDGDGDMTASGGTTIGGTGGAGTGGVVGGTGGSTIVNPTMPGTAVGTPITAGTFAVDAMGFGTDATNGFQGFAYTYADMGGSVIYPPNFTTISETEISEGKLCVNGTGAQVLDMMYSTYWGAGLGWNLNQAVDGDPAPISVADFDGVTFTMVAPVTVTTRFLVNVGTQGYCTEITAGESTIEWTELNSTCWDGLGDFFDPATMLVDSVAWQVVTNPGAPAPFDFCVGGLEFNGGDGMGGGAGGPAQ